MMLLKQYEMDRKKTYIFSIDKQPSYNPTLAFINKIREKFRHYYGREEYVKNELINKYIKKIYGAHMHFHHFYWQKKTHEMIKGSVYDMEKKEDKFYKDISIAIKTKIL